MSSNKILVTESGMETVLKVTQTANELRVDCVNVDTNEQYYFVKNLIDNTVYSSITGEIIHIENGEESRSVNQVMLSKASGTWSKKVSYKTMAKALGTVTTYAALIAWAMVFVGFSAIAANAASAVAYLMQMINDYLPKKYSKHGLKFTMRHKKIKKHQGGGVIYVTISEACGCTTY